MTTLLDLSQPELDVMTALVQSKTTSVVVLAADLWRTTPDWLAEDPYPLLTYLLDNLSGYGLVRFRIVKPASGSFKPGTKGVDLPFDIRLTPKGWQLMGYGHQTVEAGSRGRHQRESAHPGDMTDYVNLAGHTYGGPIEVDDFPTHRRNYPRHIHMYGEQLTMANTAATSREAKRTERLADPTVLADPNGTGDKRGYIRVTPEVEARVLATREVMGTGALYADIANAADLPERTVQYILTDLPRLRRSESGETTAAKSLKERAYAVIEVLQPIKDVQELRRVLGMADTEHDVMHVLHSLHTQGRIDFDERGSGMGKATVINIRLPKKGGKRVKRETFDALPEIVKDRLPEQVRPLTEDEQEVATVLAVLEGGDVVDATGLTVALTSDIADAVRVQAESEATTRETPQPTPPSAPGPESEGYPLLDALLDRERNRQAADSKGMAFVVAAEAIQDIDPETAATLMAKAEAYNVPFPSPIEQEYIRYVAAHPAAGPAHEE